MKKNAYFLMFFAAAMLVGFGTRPLLAEGIQDGSKIKMTYSLTADGKPVENVQDNQTIEFILGKDPIMPGLAKGIMGLNAGDKKHLSLSADEAFGPIDPEALVEVAKTQLPKEEIQVGMIFSTEGPEGETMHAIVKEIKEETVLMDFNHPLAGKAIELDVEILEVS